MYYIMFKRKKRMYYNVKTNLFSIQKQLLTSVNRKNYIIMVNINFFLKFSNVLFFKICFLSYTT